MVSIPEGIANINQGAGGEVEVSLQEAQEMLLKATKRGPKRLKYIGEDQEQEGGRVLSWVRGSGQRK